MEGKVTVVGTGPGHPGFLTRIGKEKIDKATVLVGGKRLLDMFSGPGQKNYTVDKDLEGALQFIKNNYIEEELVVLVSGDTGVYSLATYLAKKLPAEILEFVPGISSVQLMFARLKKPWQDVCIISLHGRMPRGVARMVEDGENVALLTGGEFTPRRAAQYLLEEGCRDRFTAVGTNLSYAGEKIVVISLSELAVSEDDFSPAVMVINYE